MWSIISTYMSTRHLCLCRHRHNYRFRHLFWAVRRCRQRDRCGVDTQTDIMLYMLTSTSMSVFMSKTDRCRLSTFSSTFSSFAKVVWQVISIYLQSDQARRSRETAPEIKWIYYNIHFSAASPLDLSSEDPRFAISAHYTHYTIHINNAYFD